VTGYTPDILAEGLDVIFCGINPAYSAAVDGHNFSHRNNRFWAVLHLAGFTDRQLRPEDEQQLLQFGCGITAVVARPTRQARPRFEAKIRRYRPQATAFLGKLALSAMTGAPHIDWGPQPFAFAGTEAWVLPNPSGLNAHYQPAALAQLFGDLRVWAMARHARTKGVKEPISESVPGTLNNPLIR